MRRSKHSITKPIAFAAAASRQLRHIAEHKLILLRAKANCEIHSKVYFFPESPHPYSVCYKIFHRLGIPLHKGLPAAGEHAIVFCWKDETYVKVPQLAEFQSGQKIVNGQCLDISKQRVDEIHSRVFGYSLAVDPLTYHGRMAVKSNINGAHDGQELTGPLKRVEPNLVYQRIVDNSASPDAVPQAGEMVCDIRVPVIGRPTDFAYLKFRPKSDRFSNVNSWVKIVKTNSVLTPAELRKFNEFCESFGLDYGEVDIVRDAKDGRIYALDVNKTPLGPPNGLPKADYQRAIGLYKTAFLAWLKQLTDLT